MLKNMLLIFSIVLLWQSGLYSQEPIFSLEAIHHPVIAKNGMVASQHPEATAVGLEILKKGGNAVDAAVAVGFALAVVLPRAGNIGGGGFMVMYDERSSQTRAINYREMAPAAATRYMYLDEQGQVNNTLLNSDYQSSGVPGTVAGLCLALEKYGTLSLAEVLEPAIRLARDGFYVTDNLAVVLRTLASRLKKWPETAAIFYKEDGTYFQAGDLLVQADLAASLQLIAEEGSDAFYKGSIAARIARDMEDNGGLITMDDMKAYKPQETDVVWGSFMGYDIASMPPPSSGGVHLIQILNMLEAFPLKSFGHNSAASIHVMTESMKLAYADRSKHLGDPLFWDVPVSELTSKSYANFLRKGINPSKAIPSIDIAPGNPRDYESEETTHFTVVDGVGNVVSNTYTLNFSFGSGVVAKGTGILMNNEMSDFSAKPGAPDAYGLLGGDANAIEAGKRPLSSMTPTLVFKDGKPFMATGSPGGSRIITTVLQIIVNAIAFDMNIAEASHAPRFHHQWFPDALYVERGISPDTEAILKQLGHNVQLRNAMGSTQSIMIKDGFLYGSSDPRRPDAETLGY